jgi:hypothetical protein
MDKLAIIGSRTWNNYEIVKRLIFKHFYNETAGFIFDTIVSGGAIGADGLGKRFALEHSANVAYLEFLPDWDKFGRSAGFERNKQIIGAATSVLAFWDRKSRGTKHSLDLAAEKKIPTFIYYF